MRSPVVLVVGCVPLAVLTVWSFVEIDAIEDRGPLPGIADEVAVQKAAVERVRARVAAEKAVADRLAEVDFLSRATIPGIDKLADESALRPLADAWRQWAETRGLVDRFLEIQRAAAASRPERIDEAIGQLEKLKEQCRTLGGHPQLVELADRRIALLGGRLEEARRQREAGGLLDEARQAFLEHRYEEAIRLCDRWISQYAAVADPAVAAKMRLLRQRAEFWEDHARLSARLDAATSLPERRRLLEDYLQKHPVRPSTTASEREVLQRRKAELAGMKGIP